MRLICPTCGAQYEVPRDAIPPEGRDVECSNCGAVWLEQPMVDAEGPQDDLDAAAMTGAAEEAYGREVWEEAPEVAPEPEVEPEPAPAAEAPARGLPRSTVTPEIAAILREEAEHERRVRAAEAGTDQPDPAEPEPEEPPSEEEPDAPQEDHDGDPDFEESDWLDPGHEEEEEVETYGAGIADPDDAGYEDARRTLAARDEAYAEDEAAEAAAGAWPPLDDQDEAEAEHPDEEEGDLPGHVELLPRAGGRAGASSDQRAAPEVPRAEVMPRRPARPRAETGPEGRPGAELPPRSGRGIPDSLSATGPAAEMPEQDAPGQEVPDTSAPALRPRRPRRVAQDLPQDGIEPAEAEEPAEVRREMIKPSMEAVHEEAAPRRQQALRREAQPGHEALLPDLEAINSSLRSAEDRESRPADEPRRRAARSRRGFRLGFGLAVLWLALLTLVYVQAPRIASAVPALSAPLAGYAEAVDHGRLRLDTVVQDLMARLSEGA
ncbi:zinc-ribbon domain-containing protein [Pseudoroseicyclus aestuarii]|uniref:Putative Zn finger-like uncharacterized protein n=1 Tax=Pseudoroseicyclus aestuarii TaxID=1795041 RepID=A0A318SS68_9RHOB|nr:zinc-ribbon domain-containing protein [Pseudoroseicyclus aestuarii]PYE84670.1 putative Zn finger-like uncharacterized protein [Pseudoroseicyclus aestuarii]